MPINPRENPFPGMNPYLEEPLLWRGHHLQIITYLNDEINKVLPEDYATRVEERVYVENGRNDYFPDSAIVRLQTRNTPPANNAGGIALVEREETAFTDYDLPLTVESDEITIREPFLEIRSRHGSHELIAVIEVLSPTNKKPGQGRNEYRNKQQEMVASPVHFLEIDLLRGGQYSLSPDETDLREIAPHFDYLISLHRAGERAKYDCWPISLPERLPRLRLPLGQTDFVRLDLQTVVNRVYGDGGFWRTADYAVSPNPPLDAENQAWADALLKERGLRS